jgi:hypothetical protein
MKPVLAVILLCTGLVGFAQSEFTSHSNGLIYSSHTVDRLRHIVDSLHIRFKQCPLNRSYFSQTQGKAHFVKLHKGRAGLALQDLHKGISFEAFEKKYTEAVVQKDLHVVRHQYKSYNEKELVEFSSLSGGHHAPGFTLENKKLPVHEKPRKGEWIYRYDEASAYGTEMLFAFFVADDFSNMPLPEKYARLVQYTDCMIDTTTGIFLNRFREPNDRNDTNSNRAISTFLSYVSKVTKEPRFRKNYEEYQKKLNDWNNSRFVILDSLAGSQPFQAYLEAAVREATAKGSSSDQLEEYISRYYSPLTALQLKRSRRVVGMCSQDDSPRIHALNIAKLSAEAVSWEVFLRAHLDIMNDRFDRVSDGSYAWAGRQTYLKEIEVLDIDVHNLLIGISLRIQNPGANHYFGDIGRLGRALAETSEPDQLENELSAIIKDATLDLYNRVLMYYLFDNYNYHLKDENRKTANAAALKEALATLPDYIAGKISERK